MKRGRGKDILTGGSGDVNPQTVTLRVEELVVGTPNQTQTPLPIPRLPTREGRNLVIELLWVEYFHTSNEAYTVSAVPIELLVLLTTNGQLAANIPTALLDPRSLSQFFKKFQVAAAFTIVNTEGYFLDDLTDGAGHGLLLATDQVYLQIYSTAYTLVQGVIVKFAYRWKEVSLVEYIGIVQSQQ